MFYNMDGFFAYLFNIIDPDDPFNRNNRRNQKNTEGMAYNCAGYALNCFSWYCPVEQEVWEENPEDYQWGSPSPVARNAMTFKFVSQILKDFPDVRVIESLSDIRIDEYAFAFRVGVDDFHFVKRGDNGHWYEKRGDNPTIYQMSQKDVFNSDWGNGRYNGPIILMAKRKRG